MINDLDKMINDFSKRLESGEVKVELIPNSGTDNNEKDAQNLAAYKNHLNSVTCKALAEEVFDNGSSNKSKRIST